VSRGRWGVRLGGAALLVTRLGAQAFNPPAVHRTEPTGTRLGLFGFGVRGGADLVSSGQLAFGMTLDAGNLALARLRLRPSAEFGFTNGANTYNGSLEAVYRFQEDGAALVPYAGAGLAVRGHADCGSDPQCPTLWVNAVLGVEVRYRPAFNWLVEYHGLDLFRHGRLYLGLTTRRGG